MENEERFIEIIEKFIDLIGNYMELRANKNLKEEYNECGNLFDDFNGNS